jgi:hypothetical protein
MRISSSLITRLPAQMAQKTLIHAQRLAVGLSWFIKGRNKLNKEKEISGRP